MIDIIFKDKHLLVINKPIGLPVHKSQGMAKDADYLTKHIGLQLGCSVYNVHRLDAKTSGLVILALTTETAHNLAIQFEEKTVKKTYHAITRGIPGEGSFTNPVRNKGKKGKKNALSNFKTLHTVRTDISYKEFENIELSLVEIKPETGRWHQIRQHFAFPRFDIIGDNEHGDRMLNKIIEEKTHIKRLYLHASALSFQHPISKEALTITAELPNEFSLLLNQYSI